MPRAVCGHLPACGRKSLVTDRASSLATLCAVIAVGLAVRLWVFPPPYAVSQTDETGYLAGGLLVLEGIPPVFKYAPAGPITWMAFAFAAFVSAGHLLSPAPSVASLPFIFKPLAALDAGLFEIYADMADMRAAIAVAVLCVSLGGVYAAARLGQVRASWPGIALCGGLMALVPIIASFSVQSRSYGMAWAFAIMGLSVAAAASGRARWLWPGLFLGLAVGSRIEMLLVAPLVLWEIWYRRPEEGILPVVLRIAGVASLAFLIVAPWYIPHLLGNLRLIVFVRILHAVSGDAVAALVALSWREGLGPVLTLIAVGLILRPPAERRHMAVLALYIGLLLASVMKGTGPRTPPPRTAAGRLDRLCPACARWVAPTPPHGQGKRARRSRLRRAPGSSPRKGGRVWPQLEGGLGRTQCGRLDRAEHPARHAGVF